MKLIYWINIIDTDIRKLLKCFSDGQLYVAMFRVGNSSGLSLMTEWTLNVLLKMFLQKIYRIKENLFPLPAV